MIRKLRNKEAKHANTDMYHCVVVEKKKKWKARKKFLKNNT
jgi:hypothetical protein